MLPHWNQNPPFAITRASHVALAVTDLEASRDFYRDTIGLVVTEETDDVVYLRGLEEASHHSLRLERAAEAKALAVGLRVRTGRPVKQVRAVPQDQPVPFRQQGEYVELTLPKLLGHQMLALEF